MSAEVVVCENCNVVLGRDGTRVVDRPATACSHLHSGAYVAAARIKELEAERADLWNKLGEAMAGWNTAEARIARADKALGFRWWGTETPAVAEARRILRGE